MPYYTRNFYFIRFNTSCIPVKIISLFLSLRMYFITSILLSFQERKTKTNSYHTFIKVFVDHLLNTFKPWRNLKDELMLNKNCNNYMENCISFPVRIEKTSILNGTSIYNSSKSVKSKNSKLPEHLFKWKRFFFVIL